MSKPYTEKNFTLLNELNALISKADVPPLRRHIDHSGANLVWLRKHLHKRNAICERTAELLQMDMCKLSK